jgi:ATP-dependent Lhr-like helicase
MSAAESRPSAAFELLDRRIQRWIWDQRWPALRAAQERAVAPILTGEQDVVVSAATAAGKTEAAFLPICTTLLADRAERPPSAGAAAPVGVQVLYVSPLKALINDQWGRLDALCEHLDIPVHRWHGDVGASRKTQLLKQPNGILLITPESLEAIFVNRGPQAQTLFGALRYVVIDEMHAFFGTERGAQLQSLLHRIDLAAHRRVPRIGLSATLGDMAIARDFLRPGRADRVEVVEGGDDGAELRLQLRGYVASKPRVSEPKDTDLPACDSEDADDEPQDVADIAAHLLRALRGTTNLVFANSRMKVEQYADRLARTSEELRVPNEFFPHHGSLSRDLREDVERLLKDPFRPTTAVCTSTLELGIDVGSVTSVAQIGAPPSVAGLRQRLGRSGRREGEAATLRLYVSEPEITAQTHPVDTIRAELVQTVAMVDLLLERWYEPLHRANLHLSALTQQVLSLIAQHGGVLAAEAYQALCEQGPFRAVTPAIFTRLLCDMGAAKLIVQGGDGLLLHGSVGERLVNHYSFYATFRSAEEYRLITNGRSLGTLPVDFPVLAGTRIIFGGRRWTVLAVDDRQKVIELARSRGGRPPLFGGQGAAASTEVRRRMLTTYGSKDIPVYLDAAAQRLLDEGRDYFRRWELGTRSAITHGSDVLLFPWHSDMAHATIAVMLTSAGLNASLEGVALVVQNTDLPTVRRVIGTLMSGPEPNSEELATHVGNKIVEKYDEHLGNDLLNLGYAAAHLDVPAARRALAEMAHHLNVREPDADASGLATVDSRTVNAAAGRAVCQPARTRSSRRGGHTAG